MGRIRNAYKILVRKCEGKRPLGNRSRCEDNIRMHLKEMGWEGVEWMHLARDKDQWWALVNMVMCVRVP